MELINQIDETFNFNENTIRIVGTYNEPWFVAKDVCSILGLSNITEALRHIPENWRSSFRLNTFGGVQEMITINESALYKLVMRSRKPIAEKFQNKVCEDILPTLRKKGEYKIQSIMDNYKKLEEEKQKLEEEKQKIEEKANELDEKLNEKLTELEETQQEVKKLTKKYIKPPKQVDGKFVVYLMTTSDSEKLGEYVVGKATDLAARKGLQLLKLLLPNHTNYV